MHARVVFCVYIVLVVVWSSSRAVSVSCAVKFKQVLSYGELVGCHIAAVWMVAVHFYLIGPKFHMQHWQTWQECGWAWVVFKKQ